MLPILVPLVLIAFGAIAELAGCSNAFIAFLGDANLALFLGLLGATPCPGCRPARSAPTRR